MPHEAEYRRRPSRKRTPLYRTKIEIRIKKEEGVNWGFTEDAWDEDNDFDDIDGSKKPNFLKVSKTIFITICSTGSRIIHLNF